MRKIILSQDYLELIEDEVSEKYYTAISGNLFFKDFYPNDKSFSIVLYGACSLVVPTSSVIFI